MADIVVSSKKKVNLFDRVIQSVVIMVNMNKMNRAIDEHLSVLHKTEGEEKKAYQENILREIVFVKYQYDIMQREMYELKLSNYPQEVIDKINSTDKIERLELQRIFLEMEYDRVTRSKFKSREEVKFSLLSISSAIDAVKQNIKDEGKSLRYNNVIKLAEDIDTKIQTEEYTDDLYKSLFEAVDEYVSYINDNYDISKLPADERELIEFVIETMIKGVESDIDRHMYEYNLVINICKNSYRYFKIIDKIFEKLQGIYDESLENGVMSIKDYIRMYKEIYDLRIKTMVNDVHRTINTEDEYLEYSKIIAANKEDEELEEFLKHRAIETTKSDKVKEIIEEDLGLNEVEVEEEEEQNNESLEELVLENMVKTEKDEEQEVEENIKKDEEVKSERKKRKGEASAEIEEVEKKKKVGRPKKAKVNN